MDQTHPPAEVDVDERVALALVNDQCPDFADVEPVLVDEGWDNFTFRLGERHALRVPRRQAAVELLLNEQRWLPTVASWLPLAAPTPVVHGQPSAIFPWPWSVVEWVAGETADGRPLGQRAAQTMAQALRVLHRAAPEGAPSNPFRGLPLVERRDAVEPRLDRLAEPRLTRLWSGALAATPSDDRVWLHGDLHPRNVIVRDGRLAGLIDWGDLNAGDRSTDLACAWTLFEAPARDVFLEVYAPRPSDLTRAQGWAVNFGTGLLLSGEPRHVPMGEDIIRRLLE